jgi:hypothetical protein
LSLISAEEFQTLLGGNFQIDDDVMKEWKATTQYGTKKPFFFFGSFFKHLYVYSKHIDLHK